MGSAVLIELVQQTPIVIAYLVAVILAITLWQRCPKACLLTLVATGLLLVVTVTQTGLHFYIIESQARGCETEPGLSDSRCSLV